MRLFKLAFLLCSVLALAGCAISGISQADRQTLRRVYIAPTVWPDRPFVPDLGSVVGFLFAGPIGVAAANGVSNTPDSYKAFLEKNNIDVKIILLDDMKKQLRAKGIEVVHEQAQADAIMNIEVLRYGLVGLGDSRHAELQMLCRLTNRNGDVIWKDFGGAAMSKSRDKLERRSLTDYFDDPALLDRQIRKVSELIVEDVTSKL